jgi:probable HAF family extracellular repeat protein
MQRKFISETGSVLTVLAGLAGGSPAGAQASFTAVAPPPGEAIAVPFQGVSADGAFAIGRGQGPLQAFRWTAATGTIAPLGFLVGVVSDVDDISGDGAVAVGIGAHSGGFMPVLDEAFRWTQSGGVVSIGELPGGTFFSRAEGISDDGTIITGSSNSAAGLEAFRWTQSEGMVGLGIPTGMASSAAHGISADGTTIVGSVAGPLPDLDGEAFYWTQASGMVGIGSLETTDPAATATDASADGSVIVGYTRSPNGLWEAFRWTSDGGMVGLGDLPGGSFESFANGVSGDGSIVVGESVTATSRDAYIWDAAHGMRLLTEELEAQGVDMTGWRLRSAQAISTDGTTIVGDGRNASNNPIGFVAVIPEPSHGAPLGSGLMVLVFLSRRRSGRRETSRSHV